MGTTDLTLRPLTADELPDAYRLLLLAFGDGEDDADIAAERGIFEAERSLGTFDGDRLVGCLSTYSLDMGVPGSSLPVAGTTWVGVSPTHRRRGVLRRMMQHHLADVASRGEPLAALWASETAIYGRFGYGPSIERQRLVVHADGEPDWQPWAPPGPHAVRLVPLESAQAVIDPIYEAARRRRAGAHRRNDAWWAFQALSTRSNAMAGVPTKYVAVASVDGQDVAYAIYGVKGTFSDVGRPAGSLTAIELAGVDVAAETAVHRYLLSHDLVSTVHLPNRPVDDVLHLQLHDSRRVDRHQGDALHVRVVDLQAALRGRQYAESAGVTIEVRDDLLEDNDGTWRVEVAPEGASVEPAEGVTPDLRMDIRALGSLYMGDIRLRQLVAAGAVEAADPSAVRAVDTAFAADEAGWAPEVW